MKKTQKWSGNKEAKNVRWNLTTNRKKLVVLSILG
jgi:hypothetical protein